MKRKFIICATAFAFVFSLVIAGGICMAGDTGPEEMVLKTAEAKKPANFPHKKHQEKFECKECHHSKDAEGKQIPYAEGQEIGKCDSCHNDSMADPKLNSFKNAAHANCKGCHKEKAAEGAPTKCDGCHPKKK